ncbi:hypothetical protein BDR04DRAFT_1118035 [Suillus decipiens]|nr:hypothetical protein BDR04DRAFT_1118035 [Suillus decipiens]
MQACNSNVNPSISAAIGEGQNTLDTITGENSDFCSPTTDKLEKPVNAIVGEGSGPEAVSNDIGYRQQDGKAHFIQSNTVRTTIHDLPTEILSEVFLYCLPQCEYLFPASGLAPILLTTICRRWRQVAVGFPRLWCNLQLNIKKDDWQRRSPCYNTWLSRSRGCPLSLRLNCHTDWSELQPLLQPYLQQISSLRIEFFACDGPFIMENFHRLNTLTIRQSAFDCARVINRTLSKLPANLRSITLTDMMFNRERLNLCAGPTWAHLTHVKIAINGLDAFPRILRLCPSVTFLMITGMFHLTTTAELELAITHTNLHTLHIAGYLVFNPTDNFGLFNLVTLPNLREVKTDHIGTWPHEEFKAFLTRSKCPLEKLIFDDGVFSTHQQREEYATLFPSLKIITPKKDWRALFEYM